MFILGIDVGNYDTKSQHTTTPSGFEGPHPEKPLMAGEYLEFDNKYYVPTTQRFPYEKDKTRSERCIILTLFAIAREIHYAVTKSKPNLSHEDTQKLISNIKEIALGVGLPPTHYTKARIVELSSYYKKYLKGGAKFTWNGYDFDLRMTACRVYPQGASAATDPENKFKDGYPAYFIIDVGGYTVDIMKFVNNAIDGKWSSKEEGILTMHDDIISKVHMNFDVTLDNSLIEDILMNRKTIISDEIQNYVKERAQQHADTIVDIARQLGVEYKAYPVGFCGGGSLLLKDNILKNQLINKDATVFLTDPCANAKGFATLLKHELNA